MNNLFSVKNKVILVTGAGSGLGKSIADGLTSNGAIVYYGIHNIKYDDNSKYKIKLDITNDDDIHNIINIIDNEQNRLDCLINSTGVSYSGYDNLSWNETLKINLSSIFFLCKICKDRFMKKQMSGNIVNITSICSEMAFSNNPSYNVSKSGLKMLTKSLSKDWSKYGIRVNNISPGYFKTKMTYGSYNDNNEYNRRCNRILLNRFGEIEEIIGPVIFLISDASSYITGHDLIVDGGFLSNGI